MLHQLWIRVFITHHGGAHLLQSKPQWLFGWLLWLLVEVEGIALLPPLPAATEQASDKGEVVVRIPGE